MIDMSVSKTMTTISGRELVIRSNKSRRHYTITTSAAKYRTLPMSKEEFESAEYWTGNDWNNFLKGNEYYKLN